MKIAFQKNGKSWFAKTIMKITKSIYYHTEIVFEDKTSFAATTSSTVFGTTFDKFDYDNYNTNEWDLIDINITPEQESQIKEWCIKENGSWYDLIGLFFTQLIPLSFENPWWWFCSELVIAALKENLGWFSDIKPHEIAPNEAYTVIKNKIDEIKLPTTTA